MARTVITAQEIVRAGLEVVDAAGDVANDNRFLYEPSVFLWARNGGGSDYTVTLQIATLVDGQQPPARVITVTAGETRLIGPFTQDYRQSDGYVWVDPENVALMLAVIRLTAGR